MGNENQKQNPKNTQINGIVRISTAPKPPEEIENRLQELDDKRFDPFVTVGGRFGNMIFPMDNND